MFSFYYNYLNRVCIRDIIILALLYASILGSAGFGQVAKKTVVVGALVYNYEGLDAGAAGNLERARRKFEEALRFEPHYPPTLLNLQICADIESKMIPARQAILLFKALNQFSRKDSSKAVGLAGRAIDMNSGHAPSYLVRGRTYERLGNHESAKADYDHALSLEPNFALGYYFRGMFHAARERLWAAIADFTSCLERSGEFAPARLERGMAYHVLREHEEAVSDFEVAVRAWPRWEKNFKVYGAYLNRGLENIRQENFREAVADLNRAIQLNPSFDEAYLNRGVALVHLSAYSEAISDFDYVLSKNPQAVEAYFQRGLCMQNKGDFNSAVDDYRQTIALNGNHVQAHYRLAEVYAKQRKLDLAIAGYNRVLELDPTTYWAHYRKALACDKTKDWPTAIAAYQAFLNEAPDKHTSHRQFATDRVKKLKRWSRK
ncbi:tetratricopeptide repeat protein [bacterium]|nr:tetratricopeptide repeat protein [bacterium]